MSASTKVRVAVTQHEPVWLDLHATVDKTCRLIAEAAGNGAQLITFPECWLPGYPAWIWSAWLHPPSPVRDRVLTIGQVSPRRHGPVHHLPQEFPVI